MSSEVESKHGLHFLAGVFDAYSQMNQSPEAEGSKEESWNQCDHCFKWRQGNFHPTQPKTGCRRWFCVDGLRTCRDVCDVCRAVNCGCKPAQSYCGHVTDGYSLPDGFTVLIRFRHAEGIEVGQPWLAYRSKCSVCGSSSQGMDRRDKVHKWLSTHQSHNPAWQKLTVDGFDFKLDNKTKARYSTYTKVYKRGYLEGGLKKAANGDSLLITEGERNDLKELLKIVESSGFYDDAPRGNAKGSRSRKRSDASAVADKSYSTSVKCPGELKRSKRQIRDPGWLNDFERPNERAPSFPEVAREAANGDVTNQRIQVENGAEVEDGRPGGLSVEQSRRFDCTATPSGQLQGSRVEEGTAAGHTVNAKEGYCAQTIKRGSRVGSGGGSPVSQKRPRRALS